MSLKKTFIMENTINQFFINLEGAYAPNTIRAYRSDYSHYADWCQKYQYKPLNIKTMEMVEYIDFLSKRLKTASIERRLAIAQSRSTVLMYFSEYIGLGSLLSNSIALIMPTGVKNINTNP